MLNRQGGDLCEEDKGVERKGEAGTDDHSLSPPPPPTTTQQLPSAPPSWFVNYLILPKFEERLKWSWKHHRSDIKGAFPLPLPLFDWFFEGVGEMKETDARKKIVISNEEDLETLDRKFGTDKWRRKDFPFNSEDDGKNKIVLESVRFSQICCLVKVPFKCPLVVSFEKGFGMVKFSARVVGTNSFNAVRY
eukprot:CAMPEP_0201483182 /NCGR_PEP_ID=MMETSP0151_2-20130828/7397_1 /ASSEMBLY_ACC=CAM_ASM_000257 /TAXON_ID=200890 /ORGANISM="Paramoeba atlantica, Strain 621/1 / CCAP 1560/9" /LENGTH=190 /DNA_ID=CAMNT_0047866199 /DNA_START=288 /DNA_END=860 /DNA_ORIENTATION=-